MFITRLLVKISKLPILLELDGENGEKEYFLIKKASRKFGLYTVKVEEPLRSQLNK